MNLSFELRVTQTDKFHVFTSLNKKSISSSTLFLRWKSGLAKHLSEKLQQHGRLRQDRKIFFFFFPLPEKYEIQQNNVCSKQANSDSKWQCQSAVTKCWWMVMCPGKKNKKNMLLCSKMLPLSRVLLLQISAQISENHSEPHIFKNTLPSIYHISPTTHHSALQAHRYQERGASSCSGQIHKTCIFFLSKSL